MKNETNFVNDVYVLKNKNGKLAVGSKLEQGLSSVSVTEKNSYPGMDPLVDYAATVEVDVACVVYDEKRVRPSGDVFITTLVREDDHRVIVKTDEDLFNKVVKSAQTLLEKEKERLGVLGVDSLIAVVDLDSLSHSITMEGTCQDVGVDFTYKGSAKVYLARMEGN
ncbi:hypothetical protein HOK51_04550 [Candidatus Woesearchaeota archaeon]|jgi:hypothetical protein|nr:hypothetical protein [Candidatus Woesearchaeota archaeon]MBT6519094.1 hypothetical protein [Candidatus Woesearchaeota archaeon]MBT7367037.1 hypothetical protein [Candidatus Woesearchaeota archaeon]